jgi:ATP-dependent RNA helicase DeaD
MEKRKFAELGLSPELLKAVDKMGFEEASPIQTAVIPLLLAGRDVVGQSSTGSGKTAAFAIPAIERCDPKLHRPQTLILCPTRELAVQVAEETAKLALFKKGVHVVPIYGGQSYDRQFRALETGTQIVIGTPGRIMDHMARGTLRFDALKMVVLDEADRMLDMGFREDIDRILAAVPAERQLLFFSATIPRQIQDMISRSAKDPAWVRIEAHAQNAPQVDQVYFEVDRRSKLEALTRVIDLNDFRYGIIFCSTKLMVDDLDEHLHARGYAVDRLHGDISQPQRERVMEKFRRRGFEFLVATDVAARGLDVDDLEVVFNFDIPNDAEDYIHRIGRTGRAGRSGKAFTFVCGREIYNLQNMVHFARLKIRRGVIPSIDQIEEAKENVFFERLRATLDAGQYRKQDRMIDRLLEQGHSSTDIAAALVHMIQGLPPVVEKAGEVAAKTEAAPVPAAAEPAVPSAGVSAPVVAAKPPSQPVPQPVPVPQPAPKPVVAQRAEPRVVVSAPVVPPAPKSAKAMKIAELLAPARKPEAVLDPLSTPALRRAKFARPARTGKEAGMVTLFFNAGRKHLITPEDLVGKIAGVTRLPGKVVGAIDIHQRFSLVDVASEHAPLILGKLAGVRLKGHALKPSVADLSALPEE